MGCFGRFWVWRDHPSSFGEHIMPLWLISCSNLTTSRLRLLIWFGFVMFCAIGGLAKIRKTVQNAPKDFWTGFKPAHLTWAGKEGWKQRMALSLLITTQHILQSHWRSHGMFMILELAHSMICFAFGPRSTRCGLLSLVRLLAFVLRLIGITKMRLGTLVEACVTLGLRQRSICLFSFPMRCAGITRDTFLWREWPTWAWTWRDIAKLSWNWLPLWSLRRSLRLGDWRWPGTATDLAGAHMVFTALHSHLACENRLLAIADVSTPIAWHDNSPNEWGWISDCWAYCFNGAWPSCCTWHSAADSPSSPVWRYGRHVSKFEMTQDLFFPNFWRWHSLSHHFVFSINCLKGLKFPTKGTDEMKVFVAGWHGPWMHSRKGVLEKNAHTTHTHNTNTHTHTLSSFMGLSSKCHSVFLISHQYSIYPSNIYHNIPWIDMK